MLSSPSCPIILGLITIDYKIVKPSGSWSDRISYEENPVDVVNEEGSKDIELHIDFMHRASEA